MKKFLVMITAAAVLWSSSLAQAKPPLTNVEGVGGCALNPLAYLANNLAPGEKGLLGNGSISLPQLGIWNVRLTDTSINWFAVGANISLFNRVELGYSHEFVDIEDLSETVDKDNFSLKLNLVQEKGFGIEFMPAVSVGAIWMNSDADDSLPLDDTSDYDIYAVATKMVPGLPFPMILNAGVRNTKSYVRGVLGFGDDRDWLFFGNVETILFKKFIVGWEYQQEAEVGDVFKGEKGAENTTHSMWEFHIAYMYDDHLMLVGSYAYTGDSDSSHQAALDDGYVLSLQYAF